MSERRGQIGWLLFGVFIVLGTVTVLSIISPVIRDVLLPWTAYKAEVTSAEGVIDRTYNPDNAIYNYEWFKRQEKKIHSTERQIDNTVQQQKDFLALYGNVSSWDWQTKENYAQLTMTLNGQRNYYSDLVRSTTLAARWRTGRSSRTASRGTSTRESGHNQRREL